MKKIIKYIPIVLIVLSLGVQSQEVGINTFTPDPSSALDISSIDTGLIIPRMTDLQRDAIINPATGLLVYQTNTSQEGFWYYDGIAWIPLNQGTIVTTGWDINGNTGTVPGTNVLGTTDNNDFVVRTNGVERMRFTAGTRRVGIGTPNPQQRLHIVGSTGSTLQIRDGNQAADRVLTSNNNGDATWQDIPSSIIMEDDWRFASGSSISDPIYHTGPVTIGRSITTTHNLLVINPDDIDNTIFRVGSIEEFTTTVFDNDIEFSHPVFPQITESINLGSPTRRWDDVYINSGMIQTSDITTKERIEPLEYGLKEVLQLNPVSFQWKKERVQEFDIPDQEKSTHLGFIAQEVKNILPEIIQTHHWKEYEENAGILVKEESPLLGISYSELIPIVSKAIQEQQKVIEELQKLYNELKGEK